MHHVRTASRPAVPGRYCGGSRLSGSLSGPLSDLVELLNDALGCWGTRLVPVAVPAGGLAMSEASPPVRLASVSTRAAETARPRPRPTASRALTPVPGRDPWDDDATDVDAEHAQVWMLVRRAQQGDGEAFGMLYDRYVDQVFRFIYYRVNDRALAEDFTSETFVRALRRISGISYQGRDIGAWFVTIARNIVLDHVKSARNRLEVTTADTIEGPETAESTESAVLTSLDSQRLMAAVAQLGDEQRECVMLRFMQGLSVSETAAVMGKNDGAIKALQHRAIRKLAAIVGSEI